MKGVRVKGIDPRILKLEIIPMRSDLPPTAELNTQLQAPTLYYVMRRNGVERERQRYKVKNVSSIRFLSVFEV
jgi:hypothetical protein